MTSVYDKKYLITRFKIKTLIFLILLLPYAAIAQFTISGKVLNHADASPVANASVFMSNTAIGGKTDDGGVFTLHNVKPGKYDVVVSIIGFETYSQTITIDDNNITLPDIKLFLKTITLNEVKVKPNNDPNWQRNFDLFKKEFLGTTELAKECKILNPELLDLSYDESTKTLTAVSVDFLVIENQALGYRIKYLLSDFVLNDRRFLYSGSVLFEELKGTPLQEAQWKKRRLEIYEGSKMHFLHAALNSTLEQEGFRVLRVPINPERPADSLINKKIRQYTALKDKHEYRDSLSFWIKKSRLPKLLSKPIPYILSTADIIEQTNKRGLFALGCDNDALYITYNKEHHFNAGTINSLYDQNNLSNTLVSFNAAFAFFDNNGAIANPQSLTFTGVWANKRLAELLPLDYDQQQKTGTTIDSALIKKISGSLQTYTTKHSIEKAYLHFDKPYYAVGDTIYFKAYITNGPLHELSTLSGILDVELINPDNKICDRVKLKVKDGRAWGDFALADTLKGGSYRLRAYTSWMRNAGDEYFFDKSVSIVKATSKISRSDQNNKNKPAQSVRSKALPGKVDVQFFPEGGSILNGAVSKIAFKAVAPNGLGTEIKGAVTDGMGNKVSAFASNNLGMGVIKLLPEAGKTYKAIITCADSSTVTVELPVAGNNGYALNVDNSDLRNINISVMAGKQTTETSINLVAQSAGLVYYYTQSKLVNGTFTAVIPKNKFPSGIVQFTLFSSAGEPLNERLVFIDSDDQLKLNVTTEKQSYSPRQKVKINLNAGDKNGKPITGSFSIAVIDETKVKVEGDAENTILSNLLLTSDLKGYIEKPNYYFTNKSDETRTNLDVLMLTQGYHRFEWQQILNDKYPPVTFQPEKIITVTGTIKGQWGKPIPYGKVSLLSVANSFFFLDTIADANGKFIFKHLPMKDSMQYVIQATDKNIRRNSIIEIDNAKPPVLSKNKNTPGNWIIPDSILSNYLQSSERFHHEQLKQGLGSHVIALKEVQIKEKKAPLKYLKHSSNLNGPGVADQVVTADQLPVGCPIITQCLGSVLINVKFDKDAVIGRGGQC
jgi:hypothetical protein